RSGRMNSNQSRRRRSRSEERRCDRHPEVPRKVARGATRAEGPNPQSISSAVHSCSASLPCREQIDDAGRVAGIECSRQRKTDTSASVRYSRRANGTGDYSVLTQKRGEGKQLFI